MHRLFVLLFAAAAGYISLSQEMLWMRAVSYMTGGRPSVFAHVLGFFLIGIALGSLWGERLCERGFKHRSPTRIIGLVLILAACVYYVSIAAVAQLLVVNHTLGMIATHLTVMLVSMLSGVIFPVLCHYGTRAGEAAGLAVSRIYMANIVGSTLGPLVTGFVLMQYLPTDRIILWISVGTFALGVAALGFGLEWRKAKGDLGWLLVAPIAAGVLAFLLPTHAWMYDRLLENLHATDRPQAPYAYRHLVQNRSGIIAIVPHPKGDILYGGGMYDGMFTTDPTLDANGIKRAYMIAALHPNPQKVLEIGLASGSWMAVVSKYAPVQSMTIIEINPGYLPLIAQYPEQAKLLNDPRVSVHIDDGRRWLQRHPDATFDFMLQNTTWHWRSHATNLLSADYFRLCQRHLNPGGVLYCNTTYCDDVAYTAAQVFKHVVRYKNFIAASDAPFALTPDQIRENLWKFQVNGQPYFAPDNPQLHAVVEELAAADLSDQAPALRAARDLRVITDDNMAVEYKRTTLYDSNRTWAAFWRKWVQTN